jgi:hypothetical protein
MFPIPHATASILEIDLLAIAVLAMPSGQLPDPFAVPIKLARNATAEM